MTAPHSAPADPRRRLMIMVGVGAALGVLLFLGGRVFAGGDSVDEVDTVAATASSTPSTPTTAAPPTAEASAAAPVETFEVFTTKNPFIALRTTATAAATGSATASRTAATATPAVGTAAPAAAVPVATSTAPAAPGASATTASGGQATEPTRSGTRVSLSDVFAEGNRTVANVKVNDTVSKVGAGDTFASNFKVVSLDPAERCGRFLYGDDQFRLCKGEEVLK